MGILLIESSSGKTEFGYIRENEILINEISDTGNNADKLTYSIKSSFEKNKINFSDIEIVSLSNGPGSFTGLRIGSSIAKGICFSLGCKYIEINTLDLIANKYKSSGKIVSMIFSNSRTLEFYNSEYEKLNGKLKRISGYSTGFIHDIIQDSDKKYILNGGTESVIPEEFKSYIIDVSAESGIKSMAELTNERIINNEFSDYRASQPFYMKDFTPKN